MKKIKINRAELMRMAWAIQREDPGLTIDDCKKAAEKVLRLKSALENGTVRFAFRKADGAVREAIGTLQHDLFAEPPLNPIVPGQVTLIRYFDLEKNAIRSFRAERILQVAA